MMDFPAEKVLDEEPQGAFGIAVVSQAAATAGVASIPTPITEPNFPYVVYQPMISAVQFLGSGPPVGLRGKLKPSSPFDLSADDLGGAVRGWHGVFGSVR